MARWLLNVIAFGFLSLSLAFVVSPAHGQITFSPLANYPTGQNPQYIAVGDLNNDGAPDAVIVNNTSGTVTVLLNKHDGTGSFNPPATYAVGNSPVWAVIGDVNGDGKPDIVVSNMASGTISVLLNNGNGTFQAPSSYSVLPAGVSGTPSPAAVALGDVNNNGKLDAVVANTGTGNVSVLMNNGAGVFTATTVYPVGAGPDSVALAKFTSGPNLDILTANKNGRNVSVLLGNGNGTFQAAINTPAGYVPYSAVPRDLDGDGKMDIVVCDNMAQASGVNTLKGNGDGTFQKAVLYSGGKSPIALAIGDFNGDGRPDVATANTGTQDISLFLNAGSTSFAAPATLAGGITHLGVAVGDFDGNGSQDLILANTPSGVTVLLNVTAYVQGVTLNPSSIATGSASTMTVTLTRAAPAGGLTVPIQVSDTRLIWAPGSITIPEGQSSSTVHITANPPYTGTAVITASLGGVAASATITVTAASGGLKGDLNGDGKVDILDVLKLARVVGGLEVMN
ncbi:MAG TPA: VCBS repeat-containing protein [Armatimonadota bacterium]|jgi:hypothetical protein